MLDPSLSSHAHRVGGFGPAWTPPDDVAGAAAFGPTSWPSYTPELRLPGFAQASPLGAVGGPAANAALDDIRGTAPQPIDVDLAGIAQDVYALDSAGVGDYLRLSTSELRAVGIDPSLLVDRDSGFQAAIYRGEDGRTVLAFAGTQDWADWRTNLLQGIGNDAIQYQMAEEIAVRAQAAFGDALVITGHSLGGGLASAGSLASGAPAVTFNAAGLADATIERIVEGGDADAIRGAIADSGHIRRYHVDGDILTVLQEEQFLTRGLMPDALGEPIELQVPEDAQPQGTRWIIPDGIERGIALHGMDRVIAAMPR